MPPPTVLAQQSANAATIFYVTLLFIFLTAVITTVVTKWAKDKCLKFFHGYHVTLERLRGQTSWGVLKVFSSGVEIGYDHPYVAGAAGPLLDFDVSETETQSIGGTRGTKLGANMGAGADFFVGRHFTLSLDGRYLVLGQRDAFFSLAEPRTRTPQLGVPSRFDMRLAFGVTFGGGRP